MQKKKAAAPPHQSDARALLDMLESRQDTPDLGDMRSLAAELVRRIETSRRADETGDDNRSNGAKPAPPPEIAARPTRPTSLTSDLSRRAFRLFSAPSAAEKPTPQAEPLRAPPQPLSGVSGEVIRALASSAEAAGQLDGEHPAVIADLLSVRPLRDQAAALRSLSGRQARAVHRMLKANNRTS
ncbi:hypothetical protein [Jannaschia aquimarina]|uniref:Uncharacterized protein n=1 Tax=Jannaschia aquimarina TaxID=935700 RepID=A0A0D1EBM5_9RHOB|nr:hypothetical protein [Jannaschia aquimarina]KIT14281.1 hypothetical protein jaqu_40750 [Jannaschia aquimarina]SNS49920.1 hypothetical protein SAMN05421775_101194 [Jannaschia aquimarina]